MWAQTLSCIRVSPTHDLMGKEEEGEKEEEEVGEEEKEEEEEI